MAASCSDIPADILLFHLEESQEMSIGSVVVSVVVSVVGGGVGGVVGGGGVRGGVVGAGAAGALQLGPHSFPE